MTLALGGTPMYLVMGEVNGWEWPVACYTDPSRAEKHRERAQLTARRLWDECREMPPVVKLAVRNPYDREHCCAGMYAVEYRVEQVLWCDDNEYKRPLDEAVGEDGRESW